MDAKRLSTAEIGVGRLRHRMIIEGEGEGRERHREMSRWDGYERPLSVPFSLFLEWPATSQELGVRNHLEPL